MDKKITRKQFLLSALSIGALIVSRKVSPIVKTLAVKKPSNSYGNHSYGGGKKNA